MKTLPYNDSAYVLLARMDSNRFPGKVLSELNGLSVLQWIVDRIRSLSEREIILATTARQVDEPLERFASTNRILCYRGELDSVSGRMLNAGLRFQKKRLARINGDSPLAPVELIEDQFEEMTQNESIKFSSNLFERRFPYGMSVEIVDLGYYGGLVSTMSSKNHLEHCTSMIYESGFDASYMRSISRIEDLSARRLVVDTKEDLIAMNTLVRHHDITPHTPTSEVLRKLK